MPTIPHPRVNRNNKKDLIIDSNFSVLYKPEVTWGLNGGVNYLTFSDHVQNVPFIQITKFLFYKLKD